MFWDKKQKIVNIDPARITELLTRGVEMVTVKESLEKKLASGKALRVKLGIDPTSPHIHIGRSVVLRKLKAFQDMGHTPVFIVGDFTGVIGDTSDKDAERPMLSEETIKENLKSYFAQAGKILDLSSTETHYNSTWLKKLTYKDIARQADKMSVADFIGRDLIKRRLTEGKRVSLREMLYPLMQGYDSVVVRADIEIGGTDQWFNLLAGRPLQEAYGQKPQDVLTTKLLNGIDGRKMSSSWGNTITITESPNEMFGKTMRLEDGLLPEYFELATDMSLEEIKEIKKRLEEGGNPRDEKILLAKTFVALYHGKEKAEEAERYFFNTFVKKETPEEVDEVVLKEGESLGDVVVRQGIVASKSEFTRLVERGAVSLLPNHKITEIRALPVKGGTYKIGKHRFVKVL